MYKCTQDGCPYTTENPKCLEGRTDCPHLVEVQDDGPGGLVIGASDSSARRDGIVRSFHTGEKLTVEEASGVLQENAACVVLCAGPTGSGKTTFLARIGELFGDGAMRGWRFAGSLTLCAFERASWRATLESGAIRADTRRTERWENDTFLHLSTQTQDDNVTQSSRHLLISDLSGESFPSAVGSLDVCRNLASLQRADTLVIFVDSKQLVDRVNRHSECDNVVKFLQQVEKATPNFHFLHVQVVFSRWDYVGADENHQVLGRFCDTFEDDLRMRFARVFGRFDVFRIAARPKTGEPTDDVICGLFSRWFGARKVQRIEPNPGAAFARDFSAFGSV